MKPRLDLLALAVVALAFAVALALCYHLDRPARDALRRGETRRVVDPETGDVRVERRNRP